VLKQKDFIPAGPAVHSIQGTMQNFNVAYLLAYGIMRGEKGWMGSRHMGL